MKAWHYCVMAGLVVLLLGAGGVLLRQRAELETWKGRALNAESESARQASARTEAEKIARAAGESVTALQTEVKTARESATARPATPRAPPAAKAKPAADNVTQWLADASDPAIVRRLATQARIQTLRHYSALFTLLNLPANQSEALTKLLIDKQQVPIDLAVSNLQQGNDPKADPEGFRNQVIALRAQIENQLQAMLGDANYAQYQDYEQNLGRANSLNDLQSALAGTAHALTPEQTTQMARLLQATNATHITAPVVTGAKEFLSPAQQQALEDLRAVQVSNSQKRLQAGQPLPTTPAAPAAKP